MSILSSHIPRRTQENRENEQPVSRPPSLTRVFQLPEDCRRGHTLVFVTGQERICIENFRGICSYTPESVRLTTLGGRICVSGACLQIDCYTKDEIEITGRIRKVEYE